MGHVRSAEDVVRGYWREVWCEGRADAVAEYYAPGAQQNGEPLDLAGFAAAVSSWFGKFPDFQASVDEVLLATDGRVTTRVTYSGTHRGTWAGLPATGRSFSSPGLDVFRVDAGRIVEHWHAADHYELVVQLGGVVVPAQ